MEVITLDVETENTGFDVEGGNKRIISVQTLRGSEERLYFDGSKTLGLDVAKRHLAASIASGARFVGFHIKGFDLPQVERFLNLSIPESQVVEIGELPAMDSLRQRIGKARPRLEEICAELGIDCTHKALMDRHALRFRNLPEVLELAKSGASVISKDKGWNLDFSYKIALEKISGGMAILDAFNDFVRKGGDKKTLFYRYAIGDVRVEREVYTKLVGRSPR